MKKIKLLSVWFVIVITMMACQKSAQQSEESTKEPAEKKENVNSKSIPDAHNSRISLDWNGIYQGIIPCADCEGIKTKLLLFEDGTYERTKVYLGRSEEQFFEQGTFSWNDANSKITLNFENKDTQQYQVGENVLFHLDQEGRRITGDLANNYQLVKNKTDRALENKTWVLVELLGQPAKPQENKNAMSLMFMSDKGLLTGSDGCNRFNSECKLLNGNRFKAGPFATTLMACENMDNAREYLQVLEKSDTYILTDSTLSITKARMAVMAKFKLKED